jgi:hypothetical protein
MAVVSVAFDGTRMSQAETITDGGNWYQWGTTNKPAVEVDFVYQLGSGSAAISHKRSSAQGGVEFNATTAVDYTSATAVRAVLALVNTTTYGLINTAVHKGTEYGIGSDGSNYYGYYLHGAFKDYPPKGGWQIVMIDPNEAEYRDATTGTPVLTAVDWYGWWNDITGSVKAENVVHDAICYLAKGQGLTLTGGTSTDPDGTFADFVDFDEGTVANRYGVVVTAEGALLVTGWLNVATASTAAVFNDTGKVVIWTEHLVSTGFSGLGIDLSQSATDFIVYDCFLQSVGRGIKDTFDTISDVDATNDVVTLGSDDWRDLDYIDYSDDGGSDTMGLTDGSSYWIRWDSTNSGWAFYSSRANAAADTSRLNLSAGATGETHKISKHTDTRADLTITGTTGVKAEFNGGTLDNWRTITLTSKGDLDGVVITRPGLITQAGGTISGCTFSGAVLYSGEHMILSNGSLNLISGCSFTGSSGHAIQITAAGSYAFTDNSFTGYGANESLDAVIYNNVTPTTLTSYSESNYDTDIQLYSGGNTLIGHTFTTGASPGTLSALRFYIRKVGSPTGNVVAHLYATSGGAPTGSPLASSENVDITGIGTTYALEVFPILQASQAGYALSATTTYAWVLEFTGGDASNRLEVGVDNSTPGHSGTGYLYSGSWASQTWDVCHYAYTGGNVTLNRSGGTGAVTYRNALGCATKVVQAVTYTVTNLVTGSEVSIRRQSDDELLAFVESSGTSLAYQYNYTSDIPIYVVMQNLNYLWRRIDDTLTNTDKDRPGGQQPDPDYVNP